MSMQNMKKESNSDRNYALDFIKIIATILIVFHHYQQVTGTTYATGINYYNGWFYFGRLVELFFLISGYLMFRYTDAILSDKITLKDWYIKRTVRLLPMVTVSVVAHQIILHIHKALCPGGFCYSESTANVFGSIITSLGLQSIGVFDNPGINNPTWYISVLILVYVVFFLSTKLAGHLNCSPNYIYIFIILLSCGIQKYAIEIPFLTNNTTRGYSSFFFGILLAGYVKRNGVSTKLVVIDCLSLTALMYLFFCEKSLVSHGLRYLLSFVFFPGLVLLTETNTVKRIFRHRFWGIWGQISFNAYIWHSPMFRAMYSVAHLLNITPNYSQRKWMYLFCFLTQVVGVISFYFVEKPLNEWIQRKLRKQANV